MSNENYEYPEGSAPDKKYGMLSKEGRTESLIPNWARDPKILSMAILSGMFFYLVTHLLSYALGERTDKNASKPNVTEVSNAKISEISSRIEQDKNNTKEKLSTFSQTVKNLSDDAKYNARNVGTNSSRITKLETDINNNTQQISEMNSSIIELTKSLEELKKNLSKPKIKKIAAKKIEIKLQTYHLRAMVSGRAWVEGEHGDYFTVKIGDMLPTYGRIVYMDDDTGIIKTTSGRDIKYANS